MGAVRSGTASGWRTELTRRASGGSSCWPGRRMELSSVDIMKHVRSCTQQPVVSALLPVSLGFHPEWKQARLDLDCRAAIIGLSHRPPPSPSPPAARVACQCHPRLVLLQLPAPPAASAAVRDNNNAGESKRATHSLGRGARRGDSNQRRASRSRGSYRMHAKSSVGASSRV